MRQTKRHIRNLCAGLACLLLFCTACIGLRTAILSVRAEEGRTKAPTLFYNDTAWAQDARYPSLMFTTAGIDNYYVPLAFFENMNHIKVRRDTTPKKISFVITQTYSGKYLSFDANSEEHYVQTDEGQYLIIETILYNRERYLPMRDICAYFGWTFEQSPDKRSLRICDGLELLPFSDLLSLYAPPETTPPETDGPEEDSSAPGTETETETEAVKPPANIYRASDIRLTFEDIDEVYTPRILDILSEHEAPAVFFVTGEQLTRWPELVLRIVSEGHALGLHTMSGSEEGLYDMDNLFASLSRENELLYALIKQKTRLIRLPEGSQSSYLSLTARNKRQILAQGYLLWDWNLAAKDHDETYTAEAVYEKLVRGFKNIYYPVVRFHCTETAVAVLPAILTLVEQEARLRICPVTESTTPTVFP